MATSASPDPPSRQLSGNPLLGTKLHIRPPRPGLISRPRLLELLDQTLTSRLTLVSAPAGFGKTTALVEWIARNPCKVAWVSLDAGDDDPTVFLRYLLAALQTIVPDAGQAAAALLHSPEPPPPESILTLLLNDLSPISHDIILVLEDYHFITSSAIHSVVAYLLDRLLPSVHLIIATRSDPPLPLARLRSRGEAVEVRADDLRFDREEATALLERVAELRLTDEAMATLEARTEGWAAGLQLAALSLRGRADVARFVQDFAGTHRYVVDYLVEEVLSREPEVVQTFLLQTSILDQLTGDLCDAVTGQRGGEAMLEKLERDNLFVVPLDDARQWYRYHHLFAEALRHQLRRAQPEAVGTLHLKASEWYERCSLPDLAFRHALAASDCERAAGLVERNWNRLAQAGETNTVLRWLEALPEQVIHNRPTLGAYCGWTLLFKGQIAAAESRLEDAERALADQVAAGTGPDESWHGALASTMSALRSLIFRHQGDFQGAIEAAQHALDLLLSVQPGPSLTAEEYLSLRCTASLNLAHAYREAGELKKAIAAYALGVPLARQAGNMIGVTGGVFYLARLQHLQGHLSQAAETCREALQYAESHHLQGMPAFATVHVALADVLRERNELAEAEQELELGLELGRRGGFLDAAKNGGIVLAELRQAKGDLLGALAAIEEAERAVEGSGAQVANAELEAYRARIWLERGDLEAAIHWAEEAWRGRGPAHGYTREIESLAAARVLVAQGKLDEAIGRLDQHLASAEEDGRAGSLIEILCLRALARRAQGREDGALSDLQRALRLGEPEGYTRVFLDEGPTLIDLLRRGLARGRWDSSVARYAERLLSQTPLAESARPSEKHLEVSKAHPEGKPRATSALSEPLTEREREVLDLICQGYSNQEIADRLVVSLNTAKKHAGNVLDKLGVANRTRAVIRARELGLV